jgi:hypothetical protein
MNVVAFPTPNGGRDSAPPARPTPDEGLRLISVFIKIEDPEARAQLIQLAERFAGLS